MQAEPKRGADLLPQPPGISGEKADSIRPAPVQVAAQATVDSGVFNYMLNQEYLMAEFYACASTGSGIAAALRLGGPPSIGCHKANLNGLVAVRRGAEAVCPV